MEETESGIKHHFETNRSRIWMQWNEISIFESRGVVMLLCFSLFPGSRGADMVNTGGTRTTTITTLAPARMSSTTESHLPSQQSGRNGESGSAAFSVGERMQADEAERHHTEEEKVCSREDFERFKVNESRIFLKTLWQIVIFLKLQVKWIV